MTIDDLALARAIHILALVHWIGGVAVVTTIILPRARALLDVNEAVAAFEAFEQRFASQARVSILLVGLSGTYMLTRVGAWHRLQEASFWWLQLMIAVWVLFALIVYVLEPLMLHRVFHEFALRNKDRTLAVATGLHATALGIAAFALGAGVLGAHADYPEQGCCVSVSSRTTLDAACFECDPCMSFAAVHNVRFWHKAANHCDAAIRSLSEGKRTYGVEHRPRASLVQQTRLRVPPQPRRTSPEAISG